jgi:hypothetical protein
MSTSTWAPDRSIETISRGPKDENRWLKGHSICFLLIIVGSHCWTVVLPESTRDHCRCAHQVWHRRQDCQAAGAIEA